MTIGIDIFLLILKIPHVISENDFVTCIDNTITRYIEIEVFFRKFYKLFLKSQHETAV